MFADIFDFLMFEFTDCAIDQKIVQLPGLTKRYNEIKFENSESLFFSEWSLFKGDIPCSLLKEGTTKSCSCWLLPGTQCKRKGWWFDSWTHQY